MKRIRLKYLVLNIPLFISFCLGAQNNDATVTILGNPMESENAANFTSSPYQTNQPPPPQYQQLAPTDQNIEPTLENGFHMRFQIASPASVERMTSVGSSSAYSGGGGSAAGLKIKKRSISMSERSFNIKKKLKNWLPERKKKYRPTLCEKFR